jgi:DnaJ-class molecular chaperone
LWEQALAKDYYKVLGVKKGADDKAIKSAYRKLARQYHPDVTGSDPKATARFRQINEAYEVLSDPVKRRRYDLFGAAGVGGGAPGGGNWPPRDFSGFADLFSDLFSGGDKDRPKPGADREMSLKISLKEAYQGARKKVDLGMGGAEGKGSKKSAPLSVSIPAGVESGSRVRLQGKGQAGEMGGPAGDLYLVIEVEDDERFSRQGADLFTEVQIDLSDALFGGSVEVPLPTGNARITIPAGTQGGQIFRLREKGFADLKNGGRGSLYATVHIKIPRHLNEEARAHLTSFFDALKQSAA